MKHIHFIINPIAGSGKQRITKTYLSGFFDANTYAITLKHSVYKKHAIQLTKDSIEEGAQLIVACGGDGTINEVASCLINSSVVLGIIPIGSGNGLASNLKIPKNIEKAIALIKANAVSKIDVGRLNQHYFFSNTGIGIDAKVIMHYENSNERKLISYLKSSVKALRDLVYDNKISVHLNNETITTYPFLIFISNSNEMGYNVSLTPNASLQDGLLDVLIVSKMNKFKSLLFGLLILIKRHHLMKEAKSYQTNRIIIQQSHASGFESQIDGEFIHIEGNEISVSLLEKSLRVIA